jgi:hypothetical protein
VPPAVLAFERLSDPRPLPAIEVAIGTSGQRCVEASLAGIDLTPEKLPAPSALIRRRFHPRDRRAVEKVPA